MNNFFLLLSFISIVSVSFAQSTILNENFDSGINNWTAISVADATDQWTASNGYMQINGYGGSSDEDWLISPAVNLSGAANKHLMFDYNDGFSGNQIELYYSTDYNGNNSVSALQNATWTNIPLNLLEISATSCFSFLFQRYPAIDLSFLNNSTVYFAFKYTGTTFSAKQYRIDNVHIEASYYSNIINFINNGGECAGLKTELCHLLRQNTEVIPYSDTLYDTWDALHMTDRRVNDAGTTDIVWDMFTDRPSSNGEFEFDHCSDRDNGSCSNVEGNCYNREHTFPRSWWGGTTVYPFDTINFDLHHLVPSDKSMNYAKFNYPPGIVTSANTTGSNGFKVGTNSTYPCTSMQFFEPIDAYKGDYARMFFYLATRYEYDIASWFGSNSNGDCALTGSSYPGYASWMIDVLLDWHENDSVSSKEIARNNAVYAIQGNRNPFIDHPEWVGYIWGDANGNSCSQLAGCTVVNGVDVQSACSNYTWIDGNTYSSSNNSATFTYIGAAFNGCDSVVTLNLTINTVTDISVAQNGTTLTANNSNATYQWIDCDNANALIAGATAQVYTPASNGNYAVILTENGCADTSACINVATLTLNNLEQEAFQLYPVPVGNQLWIQNSSLEQLTDVYIYNMTGQLILQTNICSNRQAINVEALRTGLYKIVLINKRQCFQAVITKA